MDRINILEHRSCRLSFSVAGSGLPVLFIQGVGVQGDGWLPQVEGLRDHHECLTFDNRGMGKSQPIGDLFSIEQMADDARAIMEAHGWQSAHVVGHSMGGLIALCLALTVRDRVRSLALLCTFANGRKAAPLTPRMIWLGVRTQIGTRRMRRRAFLRLVMPPDVLAAMDRDAMAEHLAALFGHDLGVQPPIVGKQLKAMRAYNASTRLSELAGLPTLVASSSYDPIAPPHLGRAISNGIKGSRFVEWTDASHGAPVQFPQRVNELLRDHFAAAEELKGRARPQNG
jgi:pimeloyl-ACP methyl ester carboxylesterase